MSEFVEVEREGMAVQFVRVRDELDEIGRAWNELEAVVTLRGRHFYGAYEQIGPMFDELTQRAKPDTTRPSLEHYRRHDEIDLLLPI